MVWIPQSRVVGLGGLGLFGCLNYVLHSWRGPSLEQTGMFGSVMPSVVDAPSAVWCMSELCLALSGCCLPCCLFDGDGSEICSLGSLKKGRGVRSRESVRWLEFTDSACRYP